VSLVLVCRSTRKGVSGGGGVMQSVEQVVGEGGWGTMIDYRGGSAWWRGGGRGGRGGFPGTASPPSEGSPASAAAAPSPARARPPCVLSLSPLAAALAEDRGPVKPPARRALPLRLAQNKKPRARSTHYSACALRC
jgi:hypothetical protein